MSADCYEQIVQLKILAHQSIVRDQMSNLQRFGPKSGKPARRSLFLLKSSQLLVLEINYQQTLEMSLMIMLNTEMKI